MQFIVLISIAGLCILFTRIFKVRIELTPIIVISSIISFLYLCALIQNLNFGVYFIFFLGIFSILSSPLYLPKSKKDKYANYFTPGFTISMVIVLYFSVLALNVQMLAFDEFAHWGPRAKFVYMNEGFIKESDNLILKSYPLGGALFYYFFYTFSGGYSESITYFSQNLLLMFPLITLLINTNWRTWEKTVISFFLIICVLFVFGVRVGPAGSIYMDKAVGIFFGGAIVFYLNSERKYKDILFLIPVMFCLIQFKLGLMPFVIAVVTLIFIDQSLICIINRNSSNHLNNYFKAISSLLFLLFCGIASKLSWEYYLKTINISLFWFAKINHTFEEIITAFIPDKSSTHHQLVINNFYDQLFEDEFLLNTEPLNFILQYLPIDFILNASPIQFTINIFLIISLMFFLNKEKLFRKDLISINLILILGYIVYLFGILILYMFNVGHYEGPRLESFPRYLSIYQIGWILVVVNLFIRSLNGVKLRYHNFFSYIFVALAILGLVSGPIIKWYRDNKTSHGMYLDSVSHQKINKFTQLVEDLTNENDSIHLIWQSGNGLEKWMIAYDLTPRRVVGGSYGTPYDEGDVWTSNLSVEAFSNQIKGSNYLLLGYTDEKFWKQYGSLFPKPIDNLEPLTIYNICKGDFFASFSKPGCKLSEEKAYLFKIINENNELFLKNIRG